MTEKTFRQKLEAALSAWGDAMYDAVVGVVQVIVTMELLVIAGLMTILVGRWLLRATKVS